MRLFATKILQFLRDGAAGITPTHIAIIFDKSENSFRREIYPEYKAHRPDPPEDLVPQFPLMRATVRAFGLTPIEQDRYEADDLIATYARLARERGADVLIVSADKDLMQLIEPGVAMFDPASGTGDNRREERRIGVPEVVDYFGVPPEKVVDVQALAGNSTDNVPGAPGIGVKTAAQLINEYGDLDTLLARAAEIKQPKRREALTTPETVKLIRISKRLVTLERDVKLEVSLDSLGLPKLEGEKLIAFLKAMEFSTITRRVGEICGVDANAVEADPAFVGPAGWRGRNGEAIAPPAAEPAPQAAAPVEDQPSPKRLAEARAAEARGRAFDVAKYSAVRTLAELDAWIARAFEAGVVAFDTETSVARSDPRRSRRRLAGGGAGRSLLHPDQPRAGRGSVRRRASAGSARGSGCRRAPEAAAGGQACSEDRAERQVRLACVQAARRRSRAVRRHDADVLRRSIPAPTTKATAWTA